MQLQAKTLCTFTLGDVLKLVRDACASAPGRLLESGKARPHVILSSWSSLYSEHNSVEYSVSEEIKTGLGIQKAEISYTITGPKLVQLCLEEAVGKMASPDNISRHDYIAQNVIFPKTCPENDDDVFCTFEAVIS